MLRLINIDAEFGDMTRRFLTLLLKDNNLDGSSVDNYRAITINPVLSSTDRWAVLAKIWQIRPFRWP